MRDELMRKAEVANFTRLVLIAEAPRSICVMYGERQLWVPLAALTRFIRNDDGTVNIEVQEFAAMKAGFYS